MVRPLTDWRYLQLSATRCDTPTPQAVPSIYRAPTPYCTNATATSRMGYPRFLFEAVASSVHETRTVFRCYGRALSTAPCVLDELEATMKSDRGGSSANGRGYAPGRRGRRSGEDPSIEWLKVAVDYRRRRLGLRYGYGGVYRFGPRREHPRRRHRVSSTPAGCRNRPPCGRQAVACIECASAAKDLRRQRLGRPTKRPGVSGFLIGASVQQRFNVLKEAEA